MMLTTPVCNVPVSTAVSLSANSLIHWSGGFLAYATTWRLLSKDLIAPKFVNLCVSGF
jgi:hypothetical protein